MRFLESVSFDIKKMVSWLGIFCGLVILGNRDLFSKTSSKWATIKAASTFLQYQPVANYSQNTHFSTKNLISN